MPNFNNLYEASRIRLPLASRRAVLAHNRIEDKETTISVKRGTATLSDQKVRIEYFQGTSLREGLTAIVTPGRQVAILFGIYDHPTLPNTDLKRGDRFALNGVQFEVITVVLTRGELQAQAESLVMEGS